MHLIQNTVKNIHYLFKMLNCNLLLYFQRHMIFRNHYNMLIYDQETFLIIINVKKQRRYFSEFCDEYKYQHLSEIKSFLLHYIHYTIHKLEVNACVLKN